MTLCVGVMSGTSMDCVDAVLGDVDVASVNVVGEHAEPIPPELKRRLDDALRTGTLSALEAWRLDAEVGALFARAVLTLLQRTHVRASDVFAIGSHGQTLYHAPDSEPPLTVQVGDPNVVAYRTGITTVADFRRMDVAAGGQGAPLAPAFHAFAFAHRTRPRAVLNIGGIANLSVLPPRGRGAVRGFDSGPGNTLLDLWCQRVRGEPFDRDGAWATGGSVDEVLLRDLMDEPYFARQPPKSTGRELFDAGWLDAKLSRHRDAPHASVQRTLCQLTVATAAGAVERYAPRARELFVCGGGAHNPVLMDALRRALPGYDVDTTARLGVPPKAVEGAAFAWLAHQRLEGVAAALPTVTGAARPVLLGGVYSAGDEAASDRER